MVSCCTRKVSYFGAFLILDIWIRDAQPVLLCDFFIPSLSAGKISEAETLNVKLFFLFDFNSRVSFHEELFDFSSVCFD